MHPPSTSYSETVGGNWYRYKEKALCETQHLPGFASLKSTSFFSPDSLLCLEDGGSSLYRNVGIYLS